MNKVRVLTGTKRADPPEDPPEVELGAGTAVLVEDRFVEERRVVVVVVSICVGEI